MADTIISGGKLKQSDYQGGNKWKVGGKRRNFYQAGTQIEKNGKIVTYGDIDWEKGTQKQSSSKKKEIPEGYGTFTSQKGKVTVLDPDKYKLDEQQDFGYSQKAQEQKEALGSKIKYKEDIVQGATKEAFGKGYDLGYTPTDPGAAKVTRDEETGEATETQFEAELREARGVLGDIKSFTGDLVSTLSEQSGAFKEAFNSLSTSLGDLGASFTEQLEKMQKGAGQVVDITQPEFQQEIQDAVAQGVTDFSPIMQKYMIGEQDMQKFTAQDVEALKQQAVAAGLDPAKAESAMKALPILHHDEAAAYFQKFIDKGAAPGAEDPDKQSSDMPEANPGSGYTAPVEDDVSPTQSAETALENVSNTSASSIESMMEGLGLDMTNATSAEMLQAWLLQQSFNVAGDPTVSEYLERSAQRAGDAYEDAMALYGPGGTASNEINKAIEGEDFIPTTYEGLSAKIYQQSKDIQNQSVEAEKAWYTAQYDAWYKEESDKRSRLEGYLKAKLHAAGAQDSSAGLSTMALSVNAADMRLQLKQSEYNYGMSKLNTESRRIMMDYTNNITKLALDTETKASKAATDYDDSLFKIEGLLIEDSREKQKLKLDALSKFTDNMYKIEQDQKQEERFWYKQSYQEIKDSIDEAYKLSGLHGTVHVYNKKTKQIEDTGLATFERQKWGQTNMLAWAQYNRGIEGDAWGKAENYLELGMYDEAAAAIGEQPGYFSTYANKQEALDRFDSWKAEREALGPAYLNMAAENGIIGSLYNEGDIGGQCGEFVHNIVQDYPYNLNTLEQKKGEINTQIPQVGAVVVTNENAPGKNTGHVAVVNAIEGGYLVLTESNFAAPNAISNTRRIPIDSPKIEGYYAGTLKPEIAKFTKTVADMEVEKYTAIAEADSIDAARKSIKNNIADGDYQAAVLGAFDNYLYTKDSYTFKGGEFGVKFLDDFMKGTTVNAGQSPFEKLKTKELTAGLDAELAALDAL